MVRRFSFKIFLRPSSQAAKEAGNDDRSGYLDVHALDDFVELAVDLGAFEHIRWERSDLF